MRKVTPGLVARTAGIALFGAIQVAWWLQPLPPSLRALHIALAVLAAVRPSWALLVTAGLAPLSPALRHMVAGAFDSGWIFEQMALAVVTGTLIRWPPLTGRPRLAAPALLFAAAAVASMIAVLPAAAAALDPATSWREHAASLWRGDYFRRSPLWEPLFFASLAAIGPAFGVAVERLCRSEPVLAGRTVRIAAFGFAGASVVNISMLIGEAWRTGQAFWPFFRTMRFNYDYDVNAAGPVFAMAALAAIGALSRRLSDAIPAGAATALIIVGLWATGSRSALAAVPLVVVIVFVAVAVRRPGRARAISLGVVGVIAVTTAVIAIRYPSERNQAISERLKTNTIMARTSWNMIRSAPVFGIGIGRYWQESPAFGASALLDVEGIRRDRENAHNNFLQIFAEEGLVGFIALLAVLAALAAGVARGAADRDPRLRRWLAAGVAAFVLTWLTSHPMLVQHGSLSFWLFAGLLAGVTPPLRADAPRAARAAPWLLAAVLLASAPLRADRAIRDAVLEYRGIGVSVWQHEDSYRYREAGSRFSLYLPADGRPYLVPIRRAPGAPAELHLRLFDAGRLLNEVVIAGDDWIPVSFQYPPGRRRYVLVDFAVEAPGPPASAPPVLVHVRKEEIR